MYKQMEMMSKVGTIDKLMSFLPGSMLGGMGAMSKNQKEAMQGNLDRYRTIMDSMTARTCENQSVGSIVVPAQTYVNSLGSGMSVK